MGWLPASAHNEGRMDGECGEPRGVQMKRAADSGPLQRVQVPTIVPTESHKCPQMGEACPQMGDDCPKTGDVCPQMGGASVHRRGTCVHRRGMCVHRHGTSVHRWQMCVHRWGAVCQQHQEAVLPLTPVPCFCSEGSPRHPVPTLPAACSFPHVEAMAAPQEAGRKS